MNSTESIPQVWIDERDDQFFRITASLFDSNFCYGASVLLASYDPEDEFSAVTDSLAAQTAPQRSLTPTTTAA